MYAFNEQFVLPLSHDEVVHEGHAVDADARRRRREGPRGPPIPRLPVVPSGKPLLFMGQEFGQTAEWADNRGVDWHELDDGPDADLHQGIAQLVVDLNALTRTRPALYARDTTPDGYEWISVGDASSPVFGFCRHADGATMVCLFNVAPDPFAEYRVGMPERGRWRVVLDSDDGRYTGRTTTDAGSPVYETAEIRGRGPGEFHRVAAGSQHIHLARTHLTADWAIHRRRLGHPPSPTGPSSVADWAIHRRRLGSWRRYDHLVIAAVQRLFAAYERLTNAGLAGDPDAEALAACYAEEFIGAAPTGVRTGTNDTEYLEVLAQGTRTVPSDRHQEDDSEDGRSHHHRRTPLHRHGFVVCRVRPWRVARCHDRLRRELPRPTPR